MNNTPEAGHIHVLQVVWRVLILSGFVFATFPPCFAPFPGQGVDPSWVVGLNEASNRRLVHGEDIIFTYGPLGFVVTPLEIGENLVHATALRLVLHGFWWTSLAVLLFRIRGYSASLLFALAWAITGIFYDPAGSDLNFALTGPIILTVLGYLTIAQLDRRPAWAVPAMAVSAAALLAKFNIGVACGGSILVWMALQLYRDPGPQSIGKLGALSLAYVGMLAFLFRVYSGSLHALPGFLRYSLELASSYSSQLSYPGPEGPVLFCAMALVAACVAAAAGVVRKSGYTPALLLVLFPLFVLFKSAFVGNSVPHILTACPTMIGLVALLLPGPRGRPESWIAQAVVATGLVGFCAYFSPPSPSKVVNCSIDSIWGVRHLGLMREGIRRNDAKSLEKLELPSSIRAQIGSDTVDVYPWEISLVTANRLNWKPRFVLQSYAAYSPGLDRRSADHYLSESAPKYIVYSHQCLWSMHPCLVDVQTRLEICRWYDVAEKANDILLLRRRPAPRWDRSEVLGKQLLKFRRRWQVPDDVAGPILVQADLRLNTLGKICSMLYKVYPPTIHIEYQDGSVADYRPAWRNLSAGFLVSSLSRDLEAQRQFFLNGGGHKVRSIAFLHDNGYFSKGIQLTWMRLSSTNTDLDSCSFD